MVKEEVAAAAELFVSYHLTKVLPKTRSDKTQRSSRMVTNKICARMRLHAYIDWEMKAEPRSKESKAKSDAKNKIGGASALQRAVVRVRLETQVLWVKGEPDVNDGKKFYCRPTTKSEFS